MDCTCARAGGRDGVRGPGAGDAERAGAAEERTTRGVRTAGAGLAAGTALRVGRAGAAGFFCGIDFPVGRLMPSITTTVISVVRIVYQNRRLPRSVHNHLLYPERLWDPLDASAAE